MVEDLATPQSEAPPAVAAHAALHPTLVPPRSVFVILIRYSAYTLLTKVGAGCVRSACPDLRRGSRAIAIPTPTGPQAPADWQEVLRSVESKRQGKRSIDAMTNAGSA